MKNKKIYIIAIVIIVLASSVVAGYLLTRSDRTVDKDGIVYEPATEQEIQENDEFKKNLGLEEENKPVVKDSNNKKVVNPLISAWGQSSAGGDLFVNAYVPGIIEQNGTCTLMLNKNGLEVKESKSATNDAQATTCGRFNITGSKLSPGSWNAELKYSSDISAGTSKKIIIEVK